MVCRPPRAALHHMAGELASDRRVDVSDCMHSATRNRVCEPSRLLKRRGHDLENTCTLKPRAPDTRVAPAMAESRRRLALNFVAVIACEGSEFRIAAGVDRKLMAEAAKRRHTVAVEVQLQGPRFGMYNVERNIFDSDISRADAVIFAVQSNVNIEGRLRFSHLPSVEVPTAVAFNDPTNVFDRAEQAVAERARRRQRIGTPIARPLDSKDDGPKIESPPPGIFISYRRQEAAWPAARLYDRVRDRFGEERVFKDIDSIDLGDDFVEKINESVASAAVLLVLIGQRWLSVADDDNRRRLDDPDDFVRLEIEAGLTSDVLVIPVLVDDARMPDADLLPDSLTKLTRRQALKLTPDRFESDVYRLLTRLERTLGIDDDDDAAT